MEIDISENHLWGNDELICLFSSDKKHCEVNILAIKLINDNAIVILTDIGIFIFDLNKDVKFKDERLISLNYFYHMRNMKKRLRRSKIIPDTQLIKTIKKVTTN